MRLLVLLLVLCVLFSPLRAQAEEEAWEDGDDPVLAMVLVTGEQPGPGLWRVSRGEHRMWVLGALAPLPRRMRWNAEEVEARIAESEVVLMPPSVTFETGMGRIRGVFLLPSLLKARRNPEGERLQSVVPPELYDRWLRLKAIHMGNDRAVERWRPLFAAERLHARAIRRAGMRQRGVIYPVVERAAKRHDIELVQPRVEVPVEQPRQVLREFSASALNDLDCLRLTIAHLETDLPSLAERANAWAEGDIETLRASSLVDPVPACIEAVLTASVVSGQGLDDLPERLKQRWLDEAERVLENHTNSFAVLPLRLILDEDGLLPALAARGYEVLAPDQIPPEPALEGEIQPDLE